MCGLNFYYTDTDSENSRKWLCENKESISHRGPDHYREMFLHNNHFGFAHSRLSILDLEPRSHQPFKYKNLIILFNGEIYNFNELKNDLLKMGHNFITTSDTEVLLHLYDEWGIEGFSKLDGMYAFVIYDEDSRNIIFSRDRFGEKPLYYFYDNNSIRISSNFRTLKPLSKISKKLLALNLKYGYNFNGQTISQNISECIPGNIYKFSYDTNKLSIIERPPQQQTFNLGSELTFEDYKCHLDNLLKESVAKTLIADVDVGVMLSGGVDSSLLLYYAQEARRNIKAYTISFNNFPEFDESGKAKQICKELGVNQEIIDFGKFSVDDYIKICKNNYHPFTDTSILPTYLIHKKIKKHLKVVISGDGADELFGGYKQYRAFQLLKKIPKLKCFSNFLRDSIERTPFQPNFLHRYVFGYTHGNIEFRRYFNDYDINMLFGLDNKHELQSNISNSNELLSDQESYLPNDILRKSDVAAMLNSVEVRSPFLTKEIASFANLTCKHKFKVNLFKNKIILKKLLSEKIPNYPTNLKKSGFSIPVNYLLRMDGDFRQLMFSKFFEQELFSKNYLSNLVSRLDKGHNLGESIFSILSFLIWNEENNESFD